MKNLNVSFAVIAALVAVGLVAALSAQTLPLGQVSTPQLTTCPASFYSGTSPSNQTSCYISSISCLNTNPINVTFGYLNGSAPATATGTIVLFNGGGGEMTVKDNNSDTAKDYANMGYAVVQTSWQADWEDATAGYAYLYPRQRRT